jgi:hypothetical protein
MKQRLHSGFDSDWGWWVSADLVRRVYSSFSFDDALVNWESLEAAAAPNLRKEREVSLDA